MSVRLSALRIGRPLPPESCLVFISVRGWVDPRAVMRLEGLDQLNNPMTSLGFHCRLVPQCLNQLRAPVWFSLIRIVGDGVHTGSTLHVGHFWPIVPAPVIVSMENLVEWRLAGKTEVLGENVPQCNFVHHKSHLTRSRGEPGPPRWEASD
jgi:hypothetical protein